MRKRGSEEISLFGDDGTFGCGESLLSVSLDDERSALDELFAGAMAYRRGSAYLELLQFIAKFSRYSPFNCFLLHMQNPKVTYVATPGQWRRKFGRFVVPGAKPMMILAPRTPVLFVYDLADTHGQPLPDDLDKPFDTRGELPAGVWHYTLDNCGEQRIPVMMADLSFLHAGSAQSVPEWSYEVGDGSFPMGFAIRINKSLARGAQYSTLVHELGHIFSGHLGADEDSWWPDRRDLPSEQVEIEAESISFLVCRRLGLETTSAQYLARLAEADIELPHLSIQTVLRVTNYIESMGRGRLSKRRERADVGTQRR